MRKISGVTVRRKGILERYAELLYRRKVKTALIICKLKRHMPAQEFNSLLEEERRCAIVRAATFFILGFLIASVIVLFASIAIADEPIVHRGTKVWVVGDSNGWLLMHEFPKLAEDSGVVLRGNPVGGASIYWWLKRENRKHIWAVNGFNPDVVLAVFGANEACLQPHVLSNLRSKIVDFRRLLERPGRKIVWIGPPTLPPRFHPGAQQFIRVLNSENVTLFDSTECDFEMWKNDVHPSVEGRKVWASWIWDKLTK